MCKVGEHEESGVGWAKQEAKKEAARQMLRHIKISRYDRQLVHQRNDSTHQPRSNIRQEHVQPRPCTLENTRRWVQSRSSVRTNQVYSLAQELYQSTPGNTYEAQFVNTMQVNSSPGTPPPEHNTYSIKSSPETPPPEHKTY